MKPIYLKITYRKVSNDTLEDILPIGQGGFHNRHHMKKSRQDGNKLYEKMPIDVMFFSRLYAPPLSVFDLVNVCNLDDKHCNIIAHKFVHYSCKSQLMCRRHYGGLKNGIKIVQFKCKSF